MKLLVIFTGLAVSISASASPQDGSEANKKAKDAQAKQFFDKRDTNRDGFLSFEEYKVSPLGKRDSARAEERFKLQDANNDSKLTPEEFAVHPSKREAKGK